MENVTTQTGVAATSSAPTPGSEADWARAFVASQPTPNQLEPDSEPTPGAPAEGAPEPTGAPANGEAEGDAGAKEAADGAAPEYEIGSLSDLAKYLEKTEDDLYNLNVRVKVDGKDDVKPLRDVVKSYQLDAHNTQKSQELSALRAQAEAAQKQHAELVKAQLEQLNAVGQYAQHMLNQEFQGVDWNQLKAQDPIGYITARQQYQDRQAAIGVYLQQVQQQSQQQQAQAQARQQAQFAETVKTLRAERPEWQSLETWNKDCSAIRSGLLEHGFKEDEIPFLLSSPAYLRTADAAAKYWALQKAQPEITKRVQAAPKFVKASGRSPNAPKTKAQKALADVAANPKDRRAQERAFEALTEA